MGNSPLPITQIRILQWSGSGALVFAMLLAAAVLSMKKLQSAEFFAAVFAMTLMGLAFRYRAAKELARKGS